MPVVERRPTRQGLLPPGSSALEKLIDDQLPQWDHLLGGVSSQGGDTLRLPGFRPWLAAEWGLSPFVDQFDTLDELFAAGVPWLLERGSAASVRRVLGWLGYTTAVVLEEEGPYLHIDLGRVASADELEVVARLVRHSIPLHVHFYRVYHGWDLRALRLDGGQPLDKALLDTDSGAWLNTSTGPLKVSFVSWHRRLLPRWVARDIHHARFDWRTLRLPNREAGGLDWISANSWGPDTWAPYMGGTTTDIRGSRTTEALADPLPASGWSLNVGLLPPAQRHVGNTTQEALFSTSSTVPFASAPSGTTIQALHSSIADPTGTSAPQTTTYAQLSSALTEIVRDIGTGAYTHIRQTVYPPRLTWLVWGAAQPWSMDSTWSQTLDSRASTSIT